MGAKLIVIQGVPGAGKTTILKRLAGDLSVQAVGKDQIKENLYDIFGTEDLAWKEMLGRASIRMLYELVDELLASGVTCIVENAFFAKFAASELSEIAAKHDASILEIYCKVPIAVAKQRFIERSSSGERHAGHRDQLHAAYIEDPAFWERYAPLKIGEYVEVDTAQFSDAEYTELLHKVKNFLEEGVDA